MNPAHLNRMIIVSAPGADYVVTFHTLKGKPSKIVAMVFDDQGEFCLDIEVNTENRHFNYGKLQNWLVVKAPKDYKEILNIVGKKVFAHLHGDNSN